MSLTFTIVHGTLQLAVIGGGGGGGGGGIHKKQKGGGGLESKTRKGFGVLLKRQMFVKPLFGFVFVFLTPFGPCWSSSSLSQRSETPQPHA